MAKQLKTGDKVEWNTSQGRTTGTVKKKLTSPTKIKGHKVAASKSDPEYLVESGKSGDKAAHKAEALKKTSKTSSKSGSSRKSTSSSTKKTSAKKTNASGTNSGEKTVSKSTAKKTSPASSKSKKPSSSGSSARKSSSSKSTAKKTSSKGASKKAPAKATSKQSKEDEKVIADFKEMMNISPKKLGRWLETEESGKVGFKETDNGESVGHESGRKILKILAKRKDSYTDEDVQHIHKVVGYVKRHLAQKPKGDISASNWRYSLMNWGHDPAK